jgi:uncharacterized damage-inducible protein DinB
MVVTDPTARTLLTLLDNQVARTDAALAGLSADAFVAEPGGECNSILRIGRHLVMLRRFQLALLESPLAEEVDDPERVETIDELRDALDRSSELLRRALADHDVDDWFFAPQTPREGMWGEQPTIERFTRPFNDFTNHLGGIRAIRRIMGHGAERTF